MDRPEPLVHGLLSGCKLIPQTTSQWKPLFSLTKDRGNRTGVPRSPRLPRCAVGRPWAEQEGRSPTIALGSRAFAEAIYWEPWDEGLDSSSRPVGPTLNVSPARKG